MGYLDTAAGLLEAALGVDPQHVPSLHELALVREAQVGAARLRHGHGHGHAGAAGALLSGWPGVSCCWLLCSGCRGEGLPAVGPRRQPSQSLLFPCPHLLQGRTKHARRLKQQAQWLSAQRRSALQEAAAQKLPAAAAPSSAPAPGTSA